MMKRALLVIMAVCLMICLVGCNNGDTDGATTTAVPTTIDTETNNKIAEARIGVENIVLCLNAYVQYGIEIPFEIGADDTMGDIIDKFEANGDTVELYHVQESAKFLDYAMENPNFASDGERYIIREDVDWESIYVD